MGGTFAYGGIPGGMPVGEFVTLQFRRGLVWRIHKMKHRYEKIRFCVERTVPG
jgi:hypothetical protein